MSLNVRAPASPSASASGAVVRVHPPFASRARLLALRALRRHLHEAGLVVGAPLLLDGRELVRVGRSWAELESFVDHDKPPPTWASYVWMYEAMGRLHRHLACESIALPRPIVATYGPPGSLRRWLAATERAVVADVDAIEVASWARLLLQRLERQWTPATRLPCQLVHGDVRLGNVAAAATGGRGGAAAYLDFGFAARRPRVHDLAYSLPWIVLRPDDGGRPEHFAWDRVAELIAAYERGAGDRLRAEERAALAPYVAAVPLYLAAVAAFTPAPAQTLRGEQASLRIAEWVLAHGVLPS